MNDELKVQTQALGLTRLAQNWDEVCARAMKAKPSYHSFLSEIVEEEYQHRQEKSRLSRLKRANIPDVLVMQTFPFSRQPHLKKRLVLELYDSMRFVTEKQHLIFIGPTGCGKTGLATAFLVQAINCGHRGCFIDFRKLLEVLLRSRGDHSEAKVIKRFVSYPILLIDDWGYEPVEKEILGLLFDLFKRRHRKTTTLLTTQHGFEEWKHFLQEPHLLTAILDRLTEHCTLFEMKNCLSLRQKQITYATQGTVRPNTQPA